MSDNFYEAPKNEENLNNVIGELHKKIVEIENSNEYIIGRKIAKIKRRDIFIRAIS